MLNRITKMPITVLICIVWIIIWGLVVSNKNILPVMGAKGLKQIGNQYYRFFTAGLTHNSILHLIANICAMFWVGYLYENHVGSIKFLLAGAVCAVVSQVVFLAIYSNTTLSFGGSGYIFALCGFGIAMQFLVPDFPKIEFGTWSGNWLMIYLVFSNIPVLSFMNVTTFVFHLIAFVLGGGAALVCKMLGI